MKIRNLLIYSILLSTIVGNSFAQITSTTGVFNNTHATNNLVLQNAGVTHVTVVRSGGTAGHLGIGIVPTERLHVSGNALVSGNIISTAGIFNVNSATNSLSFQTNGTARMTVLSNGNVGVGLVPLTTSQKFEVSGNALATQVWSSSGVFNGSTDLFLATNGTNRVTVANATGNVGIGATPTERLHVSGGNILLDNGATPTVYTGTGASELNRFLQVSNSAGLPNPSGIKAGGLLVSDAFAYASPGKNDLIVKGKVGIGTPFTANPNAYALAVNGKIGAKDLQIEAASTTWPDYVFETTYRLPSLSEVEKYIMTNKHLQDVPSAAVVEKNGYSVNEPNTTLLKKVEELTLYVIEQQKQIDELKKLVEKN